MKFFKRLILTLVFILTVSPIGLYLYIQSLPTSPPDFVHLNEINNEPATSFSCRNNSDFNYAYHVKIGIESMLNDQVVYQSKLHFNTQLSQANDAVVKGVASDIFIDEGNGKVDIKDVYYLSRVDPQPYAIFTAFNDLGLSEKHPMKILAQLFKALSVGREGEKYHFAYDSMQRTYRYYHQNNIVKRNASVTTANINQLASTLQSSGGNGSWEVTLENDCMPSTLYSQERKTIAAAGHNGYIKFTIEADKILPYKDLKSINLKQLSNINNVWQIKSIASSEFEKKVESEAELWAIIDNFASDKNSAKLIKAAEYLIENITTLELVDKLMKDDMSDTAKRDLAFALSLSGHSGVENYLIETLTELSESTLRGGMNSELQKVRLMVALSGNGQVSEQGFQALAALANNSSESSNVRNNAFINQGSALQQLENQGNYSPGLAHQLSKTLSQAFESDNSSSAILAAGNARLDNLNPQILSKLSSTNRKERYAAASVLARNPDYNDDLIQHIATEPSTLVNYAILTNLDSTKLSRLQKDTLMSIASSSDKDIEKIIKQLIQ